MQLSRSLAMAIGLSLAASAALACPSPAAKSTLFFEKAPLWSPPGETVMKVRVREVRGARTPEKIGYGECTQACSAILEVLEVARGRDPGRTIVLEPAIWTSCSVPIRVGEEGYISGVLQRARGRWVLQEPRAERAQARAERLASEREFARQQR